MLPTSLPPPRSMRNSILMHGTCSDAVDAITQCGYLNTFDTHGNSRCFVWTGFRDVKGVFYHLEGSARGRHLENRLAVDPGFNSAEIDKEGRAAKWTKEAHGANSDSKIDIRGLKFIDVNMSTTEGKVLAYAWEMDCVEAWDASK
ncbi:hypothetical protein TrVE_jg900 [Triparma verrucosa]|uniref:Uncharacterized protein n=1 Tax=Triparma verrucosa TaxID=1606542 RepID=A0A9W7FKY0_9STRA|nr:hypothetical protein TrVE_jg900 [Triparma verrucosa]